MTRYRGRSASPRRRRRSPSPRRTRRRSRSRSRQSRSRSRGRDGGRRRSRTRSHSRGYRSGRRSRSRSRSPRRRSPPRSSPRRRTPPRKSPPRRPHHSPPRRDVGRATSHDQRDPHRDREREAPPRRPSPAPYRPRSRSPVHEAPPQHMSPARERGHPSQSWEPERHAEPEEWAPRRESPPPNYIEDVMRGLHQQKKAATPPPSPPHRGDTRTAYGGRSASPPHRDRGYDWQRDQGYRDRRSPVQSKYDDQDRYRDRSVESRNVVSSSTSSQPKMSMTLSERFSDEHSHRPLKIEENITVDIRRKVQGESVTYINRAFNPNEVVIIRKKEEGLKPIFDREELRNAYYPDEEEVETRVIKVIKRKDSARFQEDNRFRSGSDLTRRYPIAADDGVRVELKMQSVPSPEVRRDDRRRSPDRGADRRVDSRDRIGDRRSSFDRNRTENPDDLRNSLNRRRLHIESGKDVRRISTDSRTFRRPTGTGQNIRDRLGDRGRTRSAPEAKPLPDFSRRPDKFRYEEWMDKPEMVPKGISYFEHDNRGEQDYWYRRGRGRGRGSYRGRGSRGMRPPYSFKDRDHSSGGKWKHDKFQEAGEDRSSRSEAVEDNKPSSTTENK